ncbi:MAG TPA: Trp biosynthesis-associated membrane protein [Mycobacteriales bacterium]
MAAALGAAILLFVASGAHWAHGAGRRPAGTSFVTVHASVTGHTVAGVVEAVALLALAAVVAVPATRGRGRIVAGLLVLAGGVAGVVGAIDSRAGARTQVQHALPAGSSVVTEPWWVVAALGGLLLAAVGAVLIVRGPRWSALSSRYEPPSGQANLKGDAGTWDALDRGEDPTA